MEIVLMCSGAESGQASFPAEMIEGIPAPERRYSIVNGCVVLAGFPDAVLHHDADELLKQPLYRMPTPAEQDEMAQKTQQANMAQEASSASIEESELDIPPVAPTNQSTEPVQPGEDPPAQSKKKASGG